MTTIRIFFEILVVLVLVYWSLHLFFAIKIVRKVPLLSKIGSRELPKWPKVSVIMTACNEASKIKDAVLSRLADDYPDVEYIIAEDRSTDGTDVIVDELAKKDPRIKVVHIKELREGWLGKVNAMDEGLKDSTGEWILFSDADVHVEKGALKRVISYCETNGLDHVMVFPQLNAPNIILESVFLAFTRVFFLAMRAWKVRDPKSQAAIGAGAFNLVRRSALDRTKGLEWIKLDVADDVSLAKMLKESGAVSEPVNGRDFVKIRIYGSFREMTKGSEKAPFTTVGNFSLIRLAFLALILFLELSPFYAFAFGISKPFLLAGFAAIIISTVASLIIGWWVNRSIFASILWPVGLLITTAMGLWAGIIGTIRGGLVWRGTFYPTAELKKGKRYNLFSKSRF